MRYCRLIVFMLFSLSIAGCVDLPKTGPLNRINYMLSAPAPTANKPPLNTIVMIDNATIAPQYASSYFTYRTGSSTYNTDYYHKFFISPSIMITQIMQTWLAKSFAQVIPNTSMIVPTYVIQPSITELYANLKTSQAVMSIKVMLLNRSTISMNLHYQQTFTASNSFTLNKPQSLVNAWNKDLQQIMVQMTGALSTHLATAATDSKQLPSLR